MHKVVREKRCDKKYITCDDKDGLRVFVRRVISVGEIKISLLDTYSSLRNKESFWKSFCNLRNAAFVSKTC